MANALPAFLWLCGLLVAGIVCAVTIVRSQYTKHPYTVHPVRWWVVGAHIASIVLFAMAYVVFMGSHEQMSTHAQSLYRQVGIASACIAVFLVAIELILMYLQARRAWHSQIDTTLHNTHKE